MSGKGGCSRRGFIKLCAVGAAAAARVGRTAPPGAAAQDHAPVQLVDTAGEPLRLATLAVGRNYVFHYPYVTTPCLLLNLGTAAPPGAVLHTAAGEEYRWQGGVGPQRSVVAFSAICAHRMSYPAHAVSFINYRHEAVSFLDESKRQERRGRVIYCCSERSVYDATDGARVLGGPAPQPLAAIRLDYHDAYGTLRATGAYGGELFQRFFDAFGFHLALEYLTDDIRAPVEGSAVVMPLEDYTATQILC